MNDKSVAEMVADNEAEGTVIDQMVEGSTVEGETALSETVPDNEPSENDLIKAEQERIHKIFIDLNERQMLETILHNQIIIRTAILKMDALADQLATMGSGMNPADILRMAMGKGRKGG